jgi:hypothetical protein
MAERWWQTADGKMDSNHRERARLLKGWQNKPLFAPSRLT